MAKHEAKEIVKTEPERGLSTFEEMERRVEDLFRMPFSLMEPSRWARKRMSEMEGVSPRVDIFEEGGNFVVKAEIPGMKKKDIEVSLTNDMVTISGEKKHEEKVEKKDYYRLERSYGSFSRSFRLPKEVQTDKARATFKDGVLEVTVPKTEEAKKKEKKIAVE